MRGRTGLSGGQVNQLLFPLLFLRQKGHQLINDDVFPVIILAISASGPIALTLRGRIRGRLSDDIRFDDLQTCLFLIMMPSGEMWRFCR